MLFFSFPDFFINAKEVFFDSKEYLTLFANPSLYKAIILGHTPIHEGYILLFWPVYQFALKAGFDPGYTVVIGEVLLAVLTVFCFYKTIAYVFDKKIAFFECTLLFHLLPFSGLPM